MSHVKERLCTNRFAISARTSPDDLGETLPLPPSIFHFTPLTLTYIPRLEGGPAPEGTRPFLRLQHFVGFQQGWMG